MKNYFSILLLVLSCCVINISYSQVEIKGKITTNNKQPVPNASVTLLTVVDSTVVAYCLSKSNGEYEMIYDGPEEELLLCVFSFNVRRQIKKITKKTQVIDFIMIEEAIRLNEVAVKTNKIWENKDTINYLVGAFRDSTDIVIADVLKKMPGIEVLENGKIEYRGKPITKFYIENMDMLQGRYGIATSNISVGDVAVVQVLEKHQSIKALSDKFSDDVAINLKLRDGAKGTFAMMADLAAGIDFKKHFLWNGGLTEIFFGKRMQQIISYQTNNTGRDLYQEFQSFTEENEFVPILSGMVMPSPPDIYKNRYFFNQAHGITFSTLFKAKNNDEFSINLIGYHDIDDRNSTSITTYIMPNADTIAINEKLSSYSKINKTEGDFVFNRNREKTFLSNTLRFVGAWENSKGSIMNNELIDQKYKLNTLKATNNLHWIKRTKNQKGFEFSSNTYYQLQPYQLTVSPGVFSEIINDTLPYYAIKQKVLFSNFETTNSMRFLSSIIWKSLIINPALYLSVKHQMLNSNISKTLTENEFISLPDSSFNNNINWLRARTGFGFRFEINHKGFKFILNTPLQYQYIALMGIEKTTQQKHYVIFQPDLYLSYLFSNRWEISSSWNFYNSNPDLSTLYSGYIFQNYRTLSCYQNDFTDSYGNIASLKLSYKDVMNYLFAGVTFTYNNYYNKVMYDQKFDGLMMKISQVKMKSFGDYFGINGRINKGFHWHKLSFNLAASWGRGNSPLLRQEKLIKYINQGINVNFTTSLDIIKRIGFSDKLSWSRITGSTGDSVKLAPMHNIINVANLDISILNNLILTASFEYYYIKNAEIKYNFGLLDLSIMYKIKKVRLSLEWNNILNTQNYVYSYYGNLNSYYSKYLIRPSSIMLRVQFKVF